MKNKTKGINSPIVIGDKNRINNRSKLAISLSIMLTISLALTIYYIYSKNSDKTDSNKTEEIKIVK